MSKKNKKDSKKPSKVDRKERAREMATTPAHEGAAAVIANQGEKPQPVQTAPGGTRQENKDVGTGTDTFLTSDISWPQPPPNVAGPLNARPAASVLGIPQASADQAVKSNTNRHAVDGTYVEGPQTPAGHEVTRIPSGAAQDWAGTLNRPFLIEATPDVAASNEHGIPTTRPPLDVDNHRRKTDLPTSTPNVPGSVPPVEGQRGRGR